jgi:hypothetical protein
MIAERVADAYLLLAIDTVSVLLHGPPARSIVNQANHKSTQPVGASAHVPLRHSSFLSSRNAFLTRHFRTGLAAFCQFVGRWFEYKPTGQSNQVLTICFGLKLDGCCRVRLQYGCSRKLHCDSISDTVATFIHEESSAQVRTANLRQLLRLRMRIAIVSKPTSAQG